MAQPARQRDRAGKLQPPAIQSSASLHIGRGSNRRWMKVSVAGQQFTARKSCHPMLGIRWQNEGSVRIAPEPAQGSQCVMTVGVVRDCGLLTKEKAATQG